jgi:hypothetical protein
MQFIQLFIMLESTQEYKDEKLLAVQEKRAKNEPIDKKCLENMRARYSEQNQKYLSLFLLLAQVHYSLLSSNSFTQFQPRCCRKVPNHPYS